MVLAIISVLCGLVLLGVGAEGLVRGSSSIALRMGVTPLVIGLTIVAMGTSSPELIVSLQAALGGNSDLALGNIVGSNICNVALILGAAALARPLDVRYPLLQREVPVMIAVTLVLAAFLHDGVLSRIEGAVLAASAVIYTVLIYRSARNEHNAEVVAEYAQELRKPQPSGYRSALLVAAGFAGLLVGANILVSGAIVIAQTLGMSQVLIGLTVIAIGTSLPELAISVVAARRNDADVAFGNVLGSNILNILLVLGVVAMIKPISAAGLRPLDLGVLIGSAVLVYLLMWPRRKLSRWDGAILLLGYFIYLAFALR